MRGMADGPRRSSGGRCTDSALGVSACLLGDEVRQDGGHKRDAFLTSLLGPFVECQTALRRASSSCVNAIDAPGNSSESCAAERALAIGAATVGCARSQASDTAATVV